MPQTRSTPSVALITSATGTPCRGRLGALLPGGQLRVIGADGGDCVCDWLDTGHDLSPSLAIGDPLLFIPADANGPGVVLGRIGSYQAQPTHRVIQADESLTLRCGESSIDLRADGKVMIKGDDVLVRARGTQRIRAGSVSIN